MTDHPHIAEELRHLAVPCADLHEDPDNVRVHDDRSLHAVKQSLNRFGQRTPIVARHGKVIAGNARLAAARSLGWSHIAVVSADADDDSTALLYAIADNRTGDLSEFDMAGLAEVLGALKDDDIDMSTLGWTDSELNEILNLDLDDLDSEGPRLPEFELTPPENPTTKPGDLITLGNHRLLCGDSTDAADRERLMGEDKADMVFTDPPYAIYGSSTGVASDTTDDKIVRPFFRDVVIGSLSSVKPFAHLYICCDWRSYPSWWEVAKGTGLTVKNVIVWDKGGGLGAMYQNFHELILFGSARPLRYKMGEKITGENPVHGKPNVWRIPRVSTPKAGRVHNAQKPIELVTTAITNSTDPGALVLDLFLGSGTTLVAAQETGRRCYGMEIDPKYCDVIVERWEQATGDKAVRP